MRTADTVKKAILDKRRKEFPAPPWFPMLLPIGILVVSSYIVYGIVAAQGEEPEAPTAPEGLAPMPEDLAPIEIPGTTPEILPLPGLREESEAEDMPESYYVAMAAALGILLDGTPGIPTDTGLPLPTLPEWVPGTFSYSHSDYGDSTAGSYWFLVELADGGEERINLEVYFDGTRWILRDPR